jgi:hypothetical protein
MGALVNMVLKTSGDVDETLPFRVFQYPNPTLHFSPTPDVTTQGSPPGRTLRIHSRREGRPYNQDLSDHRL